MNEKIKLEVIVRINYEDKNGRVRAIKTAKKNVLLCSTLGLSGAKPLKSKLIKCNLK